MCSLKLHEHFAESRTTCTLAAIVPFFNEGATVCAVVRKLDSLAFINEIVLVDDGSTDIQQANLTELGKSRKVKILRHASNLGKTEAVRTGIKHVTSDYVVIQDADMEYDPEDIGLLFDRVKTGTCDVVFGSRRMDDGYLSAKNLNPYYFCVTLLNLFIFCTYRFRLTDASTCYKLLPTPLFKHMDLVGKRFEVCPEIIAKAARMEKTIVEVPVSYRRRTIRQGKKIRFRDAIDAFAALWRFRSWMPSISEESPEDSTENSEAPTKVSGFYV